jgi:hypothetical protein
MPQDLGVSAARPPETFHLPLLSNRAGGVPSESSQCAGAGEDDSEVSIDLSPESITTGARRTTQGDVNRQGRLSHGDC